MLRRRLRLLYFRRADADAATTIDAAIFADDTLRHAIALPLRCRHAMMPPPPYAFILPLDFATAIAMMIATFTLLLRCFRRF